MTNYINKKVSLNHLKEKGIADNNGVIDYKLYQEYKKDELKKGNKIMIDVKRYSLKNKLNEINIIDNEPIVYNGTKFYSNKDIID
ncbi:TPA: hypothetical protein ACK02A_002809 [Staphylococcus aureus]